MFYLSDRSDGYDRCAHGFHTIVLIAEFFLAIVAIPAIIWTPGFGEYEEIYGTAINRIDRDNNPEENYPLSCELSDGTNDSNTKETFLSVLVLRKIFLSGNQPLVSHKSRGGMTDFVCLNPAHEYNVASLKPPQDFSSRSRFC